MWFEDETLGNQLVLIGPVNLNLKLNGSLESPSRMEKRKSLRAEKNVAEKMLLLSLSCKYSASIC